MIKSKVYDAILKALPKEPRSGNNSEGAGFWTDGHSILCSSLDECDTAVKFLQNVLRGTDVDVRPGRYNPEEATKNGEQDNRTGLYYVELFHKAKLVVTVESNKETGKIQTVSIFDNRTQTYWSTEQIRERNCEWFLNADDLKETLNWNLNGDSAKYQFAWGQSAEGKAEGVAYVFH